jgi:type III pantothenate kinase
MIVQSGTSEHLHDCRLVIDFGNTLTKAAIFQNNKILKLITSELFTIEQLESLKREFAPRYAIVAAVVELHDDLLQYLNANFSLILLDHQTLIPITNLYKTPRTLGKDRLAMMVAANHLFPEKNCLVIGAGTCITYDFIDASGNYYGGAISPGIPMRFKALHNFTSKLPLISIKKRIGLTGNSTEDSILSGVINGTRSEIDGFADRYREKHGELQVILTGGDMNYFTETLKNRIFAAANLVLTGLNVILNFNVEKQTNCSP